MASACFAAGAGVIMMGFQLLQSSGESVGGKIKNLPQMEATLEKGACVAAERMISTMKATNNFALEQGPERI